MIGKRGRAAVGSGAAVVVSSTRARGLARGVAREESCVKKTPAARLGAVCRWLPRNQNEQQSGQARLAPRRAPLEELFLLVLMPEDGEGRTSTRPSRPPNSNVEFHAAENPAEGCRAQTNLRYVVAQERGEVSPPLGANPRKFSIGAPPHLRSRAAGLFYLVFFAPASSEQAFCSLGWEFSQVLIDCVSEADIFLSMQLQ
jgi:hypothetical protein